MSGKSKKNLRYLRITLSELEQRQINALLYSYVLKKNKVEKFIEAEIGKENMPKKAMVGTSWVETLLKKASTPRSKLLVENLIKDRSIIVYTVYRYVYRAVMRYLRSYIPNFSDSAGEVESIVLRGLEKGIDRMQLTKGVLLRTDFVFATISKNLKKYLQELYSLSIVNGDAEEGEISSNILSYEDGFADAKWIDVSQ